MNDLRYYDQWNPELCKPRLGACRECNGAGYDPYGWDCPHCNTTGLKFIWRWRWYLRQWRLNFAWWLKQQSWLYQRCVLCGKTERILGVKLPHDDIRCAEENLPF